MRIFREIQREVGLEAGLEQPGALVWAWISEGFIVREKLPSIPEVR
jgi:hypothetical protein